MEALAQISALPAEERLETVSHIIKSGALDSAISPKWQAMAASYHEEILSYYPSCSSPLPLKVFVWRRICQHKLAVEDFLAKLDDRVIDEADFWREMRKLGLSPKRLDIADIQACLDDIIEDDGQENERKMGDLLLFFLYPLRARAHLGSPSLERMLSGLFQENDKLLVRGIEALKEGQLIRGSIVFQSNQFLLLRTSAKNVIFFSMWDINPLQEIPLEGDVVALRFSGKHLDVESLRRRGRVSR